MGTALVRSLISNAYLLSSIPALLRRSCVPLSFVCSIPFKDLIQNLEFMIQEPEVSPPLGFFGQVLTPGNARHLTEAH